MRTLIALLASTLLALGVLPPALAAEPEAMSVEQAGRHYLKAVCRLDGKIEDFDRARPRSLAQARRGARRLALAYGRASTTVIEAPGPWPSQPKVLPSLARLVKSYSRTGARLERAGRAKTSRQFKSAVSAANRSARNAESAALELNRRFRLPHSQTRKNCSEYGLS